MRLISTGGKKTEADHSHPHSPSSNPALPVQAFPVLAADKVDETHVKLTPADSSVIEGKDELYAVWLGPTGNAVVCRTLYGSCKSKS